MLGAYKKHPQAYLLYVEDCFLLSDNADTRIFSKDTKKDYIENANAFNTTDNKYLQGFLQYVKTGKITTDYTGRIEQMIQTVKQNELARREYHILPAALMDAFDEGEAKGSHQAKIETAKNLLQFGLSVENIAKATGLNKEDVETLI